MSTAQVMPTADDIAALCDQGACNNARNEITGVLMACGCTFLQVLEGPREAVEDTFLRIMVDPRHHSLLLLHRKLTTKREFGGWSMARSDEAAEQRQVIEDVRSRMLDGSQHLLQRFDQAFADCDPMVERRRVVSTG